MTHHTDDIRLDSSGNAVNYYGHAAGKDSIRLDDARQEQYRKERDVRGFDGTELWSLDMTIIRFMIPRLEAFIADGIHGVPYGLEETQWVDLINQFITDCKMLLDFSCEHDKQEAARARFSDFIRDHFFKLWN